MGVFAAREEILFAHSRARLIKTFTLAEGGEQVIHDWSGSIQLLAVADEPTRPIDSGLLLLAITCDGQQRRALPFRSYSSDASLPTGTAPRTTYPGPSAGTQSNPVVSFWFTEDITEQGAMDRYRNSKQGLGTRAIWTLWLYGADLSVVDKVREMLSSYPAQAGAPVAPKRGPLPTPPAANAELEDDPPLSSIRQAGTDAKGRTSMLADDKTNPGHGAAVSDEPSLRDSLVAVDGETGKIMGVLPCPLHLSSESATDGKADVQKSLPPTPATTSQFKLEQSSLLQGNSSTTHSVLNAGTFSPPPLPVKPFKAQVDEASTQSVAADDQGTAGHDKTEPGVYLNDIANETAVETTRPGLLVDHSEDAESDAPATAQGRPLEKYGQRAHIEKAPSNIEPAPAQRQSAETTGAEGQAVVNTTVDIGLETSDSGAALAAQDDRNSLMSDHVPRQRMNMVEVADAEDHIWQKAIDAGHLPVDGAYTHLAVPITETRDGGQAARISDAAKQMAPNPAAQHLQGGTVLLEFLTGTASGITASLVAHALVARGAESATRDTAWSLSWLSPTALWSTLTGQVGETSDPAASVSNALTTVSSATADLTSALWSVPSALLEWFGFLSPGAPASTAADPAEEGTRVERGNDDDGEWELAIPDFDPSSLASTPRPIYRRKRPAPSHETGFRLSGAAAGARDGEKQAQQRYSLVHFDADGTGRRAFFREGGFLPPCD
ncbi:unnamed protein product [Jaminaea pallidilutea]